MSQFAITPQLISFQAQSSQPQDDSQGFSFKDLLNPCSLVGRVCENWREIVSIVATVMLVVGFATSLFAGAFFNAILFGSGAAIMSLLVREIRDLGTYKKENERHSDINDDQAIITLNLAQRNDELDRTAKLFAQQNLDLTEQVGEHAKHNEQQGELLLKQKEERAQEKLEHEGEQRKLNNQYEEQVRLSKLAQQQYEALQEESTKVKKETGLLLEAISKGTGTLNGSVVKLMDAQGVFTKAVHESAEGAQENNGVMSSHLETFGQTLEQAQQDHKQLVTVREQFQKLMEAQQEKLKPLEELLRQLSEDPSKSLKLSAQVQQQLQSSIDEHARLQEQIRSQTKTLELLEKQIKKSEKSMNRATNNLDQASNKFERQQNQELSHNLNTQGQVTGGHTSMPPQGAPLTDPFQQ